VDTTPYVGSQPPFHYNGGFGVDTTPYVITMVDIGRIQPHCRFITKVIYFHITAVNSIQHFTTIYVTLFASNIIIEKRFDIFRVGFVSWRFKTTGVSRFVVLSGHKNTAVLLL